MLFSRETRVRVALQSVGAALNKAFPAPAAETGELFADLAPRAEFPGPAPRLPAADGARDPIGRSPPRRQ